MYIEVEIERFEHLIKCEAALNTLYKVMSGETGFIPMETIKKTLEQFVEEVE